MTELLTAAQMKAIEQAAIDRGDVTGLELMERAGRGVVEAVFEEWPELAKTSHRAVVLCGPGNNGGDGFVVARLLKEWGWDVEVFLYGDADSLPPDALVNCQRWLEMGDVNSLDKAVFEGRQFHCNLIVDSLFGTGLSGEVDLPLSILQEMTAKNHRPRIVAVDLPTGLCSDSGLQMGNWEQIVRADITVTFDFFKLGHFLAEGSEYCGVLKQKSIGLPHRKAMKALGWSGVDSILRRRYRSSVVTMSEEIVFRPEFMGGESILDKKGESHKFTHGHALILSGRSGKTGAARLAARGALRVGAGVVTVGCPPDAVVENAAQLNAIMLEAVQGADDLARILQDKRINALCLGPALGKGARELDLVRVALEAKRPLVLDADALSFRFFDEADALFGKLHDKCVLTPHAGEFARMFPDIAEKLNAPATTGPAYSKVDATRDAAKRAGCVVLFKGADTVIAAPDGRAAINSAHYDRAAPWLATAGSGDVLAGFITGLLARGFAPMQAAETAAWLHVECALSFGAGLIAEDLPETLPKVFKALGV